MEVDWIIVDGNNFLHHGGGWRGAANAADFQGARWRLARELDELAGALAARVTIVFDGTRGGRDEAFAGSRVEVLFTPRDTSADYLIERLVLDRRSRRGMLVVTDDRAERDVVDGAGAQTMSCRQFAGWLKETRASLRGGLRRRREPGSAGATLGDFFPESS